MSINRECIRPPGRRSGQEGANLIEMAIVLPLLLLLLAGVVDMGRTFHSYIIITNAAREGARYGSRFPHNDAGIQQAVVREAEESGITLTAANVGIAFPTGRTAGQAVQVTVNYTFVTFMSAVLDIGTIPMRSMTQMIIYGLDPA